MLVEKRRKGERHKQGGARHLLGTASGTPPRCEKGGGAPQKQQSGPVDSRGTARDTPPWPRGPVRTAASPGSRPRCRPGLGCLDSRRLAVFTARSQLEREDNNDGMVVRLARTCSQTCPRGTRTGVRHTVWSAFTTRTRSPSAPSTRLMICPEGTKGSGRNQGVRAPWSPLGCLSRPRAGCWSPLDSLSPRGAFARLTSARGSRGDLATTTSPTRMGAHHGCTA